MPLVAAATATPGTVGTATTGAATAVNGTTTTSAAAGITMGRRFIMGSGLHALLAAIAVIPGVIRVLNADEGIVLLALGVLVEMLSWRGCGCGRGAGHRRGGPMRRVGSIIISGRSDGVVSMIISGRNPIAIVCARGNPSGAALVVPAAVALGLEGGMVLRLPG